LNDTRYHRIAYTARSTSRFREYFDQDLDFTRTGDPVLVDVPASARPAAPLINYVVPTFGWQRQTQSNVKRSVRFGGGLRVYLDRPWFSSGDGELLGVVLYDSRNGAFAGREAWGRFITQWGADPIWTSPALPKLPAQHNLSNFTASEYNLSLPGQAPGRVSVVGYPVAFDYDSQKWFADLTVNTNSEAYTPFVRLALVRYQPFALPDAKLSAVVLADFSQLAPERSAVLTADPYHPRRLRLTVSGPAPAGPPPTIAGAKPTDPVSAPTQVIVTLQRRHPAISTDVGWQDAPTSAVTITPSSIVDPSGLVRWTGTLTLAGSPKPGLFRVLVREYEYLSANYVEPIRNERGQAVRSEPPKRLIYAEAIAIDEALIGGPTTQTGTELGA
jgi:hypothetical protein